MIPIAPTIVADSPNPRALFLYFQIALYPSPFSRGFAASAIMPKIKLNGLKMIGKIKRPIKPQTNPAIAKPLFRSTGISLSNGLYMFPQYGHIISLISTPHLGHTHCGV